jgi:glycine/D-amino acid oxidase-like deaminating enzyme
VSKSVRPSDVVAVVAQLRQEWAEWVSPAEVAHALEIEAQQAGAVLADAARDGLLERRRLTWGKVLYRLPAVPERGS